MKVVFDKTGNYSDCLVSYLKLEKYGDANTDCSLFYGYSMFNNESILNGYKSCEKNFYLDLHSPCGLYDSPEETAKHMELGQRFDKVFTICPYTAEYFNNYYDNDKYEAVMFPYNENDAVEGDPEKEFDLMYWGGVNSDDHAYMLRVMVNNGNYNYFRLGNGHPAAIDRNTNTNVETGVDVPRRDLWQTLRKTKILLVSNHLYLNSIQSQTARGLPGIEKNQAFSHLQHSLLPQIKTRPIEAAMNKTLILCKRDPWNVLDHWFEPDKDFVYYDSNEELEEKVSSILENWDDYKPIIESAYNKAKKLYTSEKLMQKIKEYC